MAGTLLSIRRMATSTRLPRNVEQFTLEHFVQRARTIQLYRRIQRSVRYLDPTTKRELTTWARTDFDRHRHVTDINRIKYLYSTGARQVQQMEATLGLAR